MVAAEAIDSTIHEILNLRGKKQEHLIPILQDVQKEYGYLSKENLIKISEHLELSPNEVYGVASFYQQFKFIKPGKHIISVCLGTACFVKGGNILAEAVRTKLGIEPGETTEDGLFSFERVACLGCCALSPVVQIDNEIYGQVKPSKLLQLINRMIKKEKSKEEPE
ncbi:NADH-quinone oxidoreductase subunit E [Candidatus Heimdallarchaeota archaeon B3_Heim]|nr:MAG: NADH-quinone oxidoreductase subunit E [Candidatus Heimdallarchaeota archaeon B3_Heim]